MSNPVRRPSARYPGARMPVMRAPRARRRSTIGRGEGGLPRPCPPVTMTQGRTARPPSPETTRRLAIWSIFAATSDGRRHSPRSPVSAAVNAGSAPKATPSASESPTRRWRSRRERIAGLRSSTEIAVNPKSTSVARRTIAAPAPIPPSRPARPLRTPPKTSPASSMTAAISIQSEGRRIRGERARVGAKRKGGKRSNLQNARPPRYRAKPGHAQQECLATRTRRGTDQFPSAVMGGPGNQEPGPPGSGSDTAVTTALRPMRRPTAVARKPGQQLHRDEGGYQVEGAEGRHTERPRGERVGVDVEPHDVGPEERTALSTRCAIAHDTASAPPIR